MLCEPGPATLSGVQVLEVAVTFSAGGETNGAKLAELQASLYGHRPHVVAAQRFGQKKDFGPVTDMEQSISSRAVAAEINRARLSEVGAARAALCGYRRLGLCLQTVRPDQVLTTSLLRSVPAQRTLEGYYRCERHCLPPKGRQQLRVPHGVDFL